MSFEIKNHLQQTPNHQGNRPAQQENQNAPAERYRVQDENCPSKIWCFYAEPECHEAREQPDNDMNDPKRKIAYSCESINYAES